MIDPAPFAGASGKGQVVVVRTRAANARGHGAVTLEAVARRIAALLGYAYAGDHDPAVNHADPLYFVPDDTLLHADAARLGIRTEDSLFGGVVPYPFVATKSLSHPALEPTSAVPEGWSHGLAARFADAVLPGFSVFSADDAHRACERILQLGDARLKPALGIGGTAQSVVTSQGECDAALASIDDAQLRQFGVAIELNLIDTVTYSIGQSKLAGQEIAYHGTQRLTSNHAGDQVYGGSELCIVRGGFDDLLQPDLPAPIERAIRQARRYDEAVEQTFPEFFASRRNYDVIRGRDRGGKWHCGVLEQSWRIGGASPAEIAAFEVFRADPTLTSVQASTHEVYSLQPPPPHAHVYFRGEDERVGPLTKYSEIRIHGNPA